MKDKLMFAAEVAVVLVVIGLIQSKVMSVPVVGAYLPGYTPKA
jgi:hypothetical protein